MYKKYFQYCTLLFILEDDSQSIIIRERRDGKLRKTHSLTFTQSIVLLHCKHLQLPSKPRKLNNWNRNSTSSSIYIFKKPMFAPTFSKKKKYNFEGMVLFCARFLRFIIENNKPKLLLDSQLKLVFIIVWAKVVPNC